MARLGGDLQARGRLLCGELADPHTVLGLHAVEGRWVVRVYHPHAVRAEALQGAQAYPLERVTGGLFAGEVPGAEAYRVRLHFSDGSAWEREDPYRFLPTLGELDLHLFAEGRHRRLWEALGARPCTQDGVAGVAFAVWAPGVRRVSVVGDFCDWDGRQLPMRALGSSGVWELFVPWVEPGAHYKFELFSQAREIVLKADPLARAAEAPPNTASRVVRSEYEWGDGAYLAARAERDPRRAPLSVYEVHLGSWLRVPEEGDRVLSYRELAPALIAHAQRFGFTHLELLPIAEHPFTGSWGYQVSGYYAPTARHGEPDDLRYFVDQCHQAGIGVILDWVPAHFPKDDFSLGRFTGECLYEHPDPRRGYHPDWDTLIFDLGRPEVRCFLLANALYWLEEFHFDALRVDAVASMLYLDYSREPGGWIPNQHGGNENLEAVSFFRELNRWVPEECPGCFTVAEESTAWPEVTKDVAEGGLGFTFKWNMGWMHDTLEVFRMDPIYRQYHLGKLTFSMVYEYSERFVMPLSHDEVVHMKGSLWRKMPGDDWQRLANLRLLLSYMFTRPGKQLLFMGTELAPDAEWNHDKSLDWHLWDADPARAAFARFLEQLGAVYHAHPSLWEADHEPRGFAWIDCDDAEHTVISYRRIGGDEQLVVVLNLTPVPRSGFRVGLPLPGPYGVLFDSDAADFGGSGGATEQAITASEQPWKNQPCSAAVDLPPLGALILQPPPREPEALDSDDMIAVVD
ncbi:MAG: 1,4-alpha-glucan branching protein GlgB [Planctomycetes bacterium]|nr:1,4-alpha-glucan branching protein GlgB [Planctomycetota bacterium]